jgi:hypothetical protein
MPPHALGIVLQADTKYAREKLAINLLKRPVVICGVAPNKSPKLGRLVVQTDGSMWPPSIPGQYQIAPVPWMIVRGASVPPSSAMSSPSPGGRSSPTPHTPHRLGPNGSLARHAPGTPVSLPPRQNIPRTPVSLPPRQNIPGTPVSLPPRQNILPLTPGQRSGPHNNDQAGRHGPTRLSVKPLPRRSPRMRAGPSGVPPFSHKSSFPAFGSGSQMSDEEYEADLASMDGDSRESTPHKRRREAADAGGHEQPPTRRTHPLQRSGALQILN